MKNLLIFTFIFANLIFTACHQSKCKHKELACEHHDYVPISQDTLSMEEQIDKGQRLVTALGCNDCHSPKIFSATGVQINDSLRLSGHHGPLPLPEAPFKDIDKRVWMLFTTDGTASIGPWGVSYASNLTPHENGLGSWSFDQFLRAMQEGKYKGQANGRMLLPPMPWPGYKALTTDELKAIFSYLQSLPPVNNLVPPPIGPQMIN